jgi:hypothetical protein
MLLYKIYEFLSQFWAKKMAFFTKTIKILLKLAVVRTKNADIFVKIFLDFFNHNIDSRPTPPEQPAPERRRSPRPD